MNPEYAAYCQTDGDFYDAPSRIADAGSPETARYGAARAPVPDGWVTARSGDWLSFLPTGVTLPAQGWKIHVSAATDNAESVLRRVHAHCLARRLPHKFVPGPRLLKLRNAKYADRAGSGKFITVYPVDEDSFPALCQELAGLLAGEHGPYVLSDLRIGDGPVHVRYGAFAARYCLGADGRPVQAIEDPTGTLVPDPREPRFTLPDWVTPPDFLRPHLAARTAVGTSGLPYELQGALHFSNGGGVYLARDTRTGDTAVLKEARPYAGLGTDGADAVTRLDRERAALEQLAGLDCVPRVLDTFDLGDHRFLALEHIPGRTLNTEMVRRFPLSHPAPTPTELAEYTAWAERMYQRVEAAVAQVHARGLVFSDLHMSNIMVGDEDDGGRVVLLDFEAAFPADEDQRGQVVANPAFVAPADRTGRDIDRYALACLRLALFLPLTTLFMVDRDRAPRLARYAADTYPVDAATLEPAVRQIVRGLPDADAESGPPLPGPGDWPRSRDSMARALAASCTSDRPDRCFPGDIAQFANPAGGLCFGHGAAGVLYALRETGAPDCPEAEEWLLDRVKSPAPGTPPGFHDGLAGIAWTLHRLGHPAQAAELAHLLIRQPLDHLTPDLHGGLAGIALALHDLAQDTGDAELATAADRCVDRAARALTAGPQTSRTGLLYGATGLALLFIRRHEAIGDPTFLDLAATALRRDLDRCRPAPGGGLHVVEGRRLMPYLGAGSAGLALVLDDYLTHRPDDDRFCAARRAIEPALRSAFYIQPALYRGIGGLVLHLARTHQGDPAERRRVIDRHIRLMGLEATPYDGELAFPGEQLMRRSMDLATGTAGCLLALGAALADRPVCLPFLPPLTAPPVGAP
ncbi:class III lanthionine synthetase LanKC [Streptomyces sp. NPDC059477]|uniref:class III lanthionine synthetase LanKC n=1 Tax=Streptomyces sp. NPDC059477 TaxID=3346847 RepID=UPI003687B1B6